jgi:L-fuconolactonase
MTIDAHHHFWRYNRADYGWIDDRMSRIRRDFLPAHLEQEIRAAEIDGVITVQARQTLDETRWLLELAGEHPWIRGIVGWVPLISPTVDADLDSFVPHPQFRGVRHVLQDEPDDYMQTAEFNRGINLLTPRGLAYDILITERQLPAAIAMVDRHPDQTFILDHLAKPRIAHGMRSPWREYLNELAGRDNVFCKLSGMVTEASYDAWTPAQLRPYVEVALEAFTPKRLMFGSDWPVCLVACEYARWTDLVRSFVASLTQAEQADIMGNTAQRAYGL